jgi:RNA polymerase subunit RPABC4/transcription elongation factor Spt4
MLLTIFSLMLTDGKRDAGICSAVVANVGPMKAATSGWTGYLIVVRQPDNSTVAGRVKSLGNLATMVQGDTICTRLVSTDLELKLPKQKVWTRVIFVRHDLAPTP